VWSFRILRWAIITAQRRSLRQEAEALNGAIRSMRALSRSVCPECEELLGDDDTRAWIFEICDMCRSLPRR
jgi:hypothetical protein